MKSVIEPGTTSALFARARVIPIVIVGGLILLTAWLWPLSQVEDVAVDLRIYRGAIESMLHGHGLYDYAMPLASGPAPFLYPPFAALVMLPAQGLPLGSVARGWMLIQVGMTVVVSWLLLRDARWRRGPAVPVVSWLLVLVSHPVMFGISFGQISLTITVLALLDIVVLPARWRGTLIGIAGALKLTPMFFVPYFLLTRQWRAAINASAAFFCAAALGFVALPRESLTYWTSIVFRSERIPNLDSPSNLTIFGDLLMWDVPDPVRGPLWLSLALGVAVLALAAGRRHFRAGESVAAAIVIGLASTTIGPVAWNHHLVWLVVARLYVVLNSSRREAAVGWILLALSIVMSPIWPNEGEPVLWRKLSGMIPLLVCIGLSCVGLPRRQGASRAAGTEQPVIDESVEVRADA